MDKHFLKGAALTGLALFGLGKMSNKNNVKKNPIKRGKSKLIIFGTKIPTSIIKKYKKELKELGDAFKGIDRTIILVLPAKNNLAGSIGLQLKIDYWETTKVRSFFDTLKSLSFRTFYSTGYSPSGKTSDDYTRVGFYLGIEETQEIKDTYFQEKRKNLKGKLPPKLRNPIDHDPTEWLQENFPGKAKYSITYEVWDEESLEIGDTDEKGFYEKDVKIKDFDDLVAVVDEMRNLEDGHWSQGPKVSAKDLTKGHVWYEGLYNKDIKTGDREYHSYHFKNLTDDEALYILTGLE